MFTILCALILTAHYCLFKTQWTDLDKPPAAALIPEDDHAISAHVLLSISCHPHAQLLQLPNVKVLMNRQAHIHVRCTNSNNKKPNNGETKSVQPVYPHQYK